MRSSHRLSEDSRPNRFGDASGRRRRRFPAPTPVTEQDLPTDEKPPRRGAGGRPTVWRPEFTEQGGKLAAIGATEEQIADFFEVNITTLWRWKSRYPEFC